MTRQMTFNGKTMEAEVRRRWCNSDWDNRETMEITVRMTHEEAASLFTNDATWSLDEEDMSRYSTAGPLIDHRDGRITAWMGVPTDRELLNILVGKM